MQKSKRHSRLERESQTLAISSESENLINLV